MKNFIVYDKEGRILRTGCCQDETFYLQPKESEFVMEGTANDATQKIIDGKVVDKSAEEIEADNPPTPEIPEGRRLTFVTKEQWQNVLNRLDKLDKKFIGRE